MNILIFEGKSALFDDNFLSKLSVKPDIISNDLKLFSSSFTDLIVSNMGQDDKSEINVVIVFRSVGIFNNEFFTEQITNLYETALVFKDSFKGIHFTIFSNNVNHTKSKLIKNGAKINYYKVLNVNHLNECFINEGNLNIKYICS